MRARAQRRSGGGIVHESMKVCLAAVDLRHDKVDATILNAQQSSFVATRCVVDRDGDKAKTLLINLVSAR